MSPQLNNHNLLIVDDEAGMRESLKDCLHACGYQVFLAEDGEKALQLVRKQDFRIAILDLHLPGRDGITVLNLAQKIRPGLKGVIITAHPSVETTTKAIRQGAVDYITKPVKPEILERIITRITEDNRRQAVSGNAIQSNAEQPAGGTAAPTAANKEMLIPASDDFTKKAALRSPGEYRALYNWSIADPAGFWSLAAEQLSWQRKWDKFLEYDFGDNPEVRYFIGGRLNVSYNCLDRHLHSWRKNKAALVWQGEPEEETRVYTYQQLYHEVCRFANVLKKLGVKQGEVVSMYLPMVPELAVAMLACARIGAVHNVIFSGFSAGPLRERLLDSHSRLLITADGYYRKGEKIPSKSEADAALKDCPAVKDVIVVRRLGSDIRMQAGRDRWWHEEMNAADIGSDCPAAELEADSPLFILYVGGNNGRPKAVMHTQAGYLLHCYQSMKWIFDIKEEDTYWCTADIGCITGQSYVVYGPLASGTTSLMFEGLPDYPRPDRFWRIIEKFKVNIFYTSPASLRSLLREGNDWPNRHDLSSLRLLGSLGEPIDGDVWKWYYGIIGKGRCPVLDTWWQTETGGILITPLPGAVPAKPGSATLPFPGIEPVILRDDGSEAGIDECGSLCIRKPWPGMMRTVHGDRRQFKETYFSKFPGFYFSGDCARKDADGYYWIMGRTDDVIHVSGCRLSTGEIENSLRSHPGVAEAAVVGRPHHLKGQGIHAMVVLKPGTEPGVELAKDLMKHICERIGRMAEPDIIRFVDSLPRTPDGKIMRQLVAGMAAGDKDTPEDADTLAEPATANRLINERVHYASQV